MSGGAIGMKPAQRLRDHVERYAFDRQHRLFESSDITDASGQGRVGAKLLQHGFARWRATRAAENIVDIDFGCAAVRSDSSRAPTSLMLPVRVALARNFSSTASRVGGRRAPPKTSST